MKSKQTFNRIWMIVLSLALIASCGDPEKSEDDASAKGATTDLTGSITERSNTGCVQGAIIDGITGQKMDLTAASEGDGIFVLIRDRKIQAQVVTNHGNAVLNGEFFVCGVPVDEIYPIFASFAGYNDFQSLIRIDSTLRPKANAATEDLVKPDPVFQGNIRMFPVGANTRDLALRVYNNGEPVKDAIVRLEQDTGNALSVGNGGYLAPNNTRVVSRSLRTNENGEAVFKADGLTIGATYRYTVIPLAESYLYPSNGSFVLGVGTNDATGQDSFAVEVDLSTDINPLSIVSCNARELPFNDAGEVQIVFNQELKLIEPDKITATLLSATAVGDIQAALAENELDNDVAEQVIYEIDGHVLTLKPVFEADMTPLYDGTDANDPRDLQVVYAGLQVRALAARAGATTALDALPGAGECLVMGFFEN